MHRSLGIHQQACFYGTAHVQPVLLIVLIQHVPHNGQGSHSPYNNVKQRHILTYSFLSSADNFG